MDICQNEECPNYDKDEPNKCNLFKQVGECPTPDYLTEKEAHLSIGSSAGLEGHYLEKAAQVVRYYLKHQNFPKWEDANEEQKGCIIACENIEKLILKKAA